MKKTIILSLSICWSVVITGQNIAWLNTIGSTSFDSASIIKTDESDNIYVMGSFTETVDFDPGSGVFLLTSTAFKDIYLQKLDSEGNFIWAVAFGSAEYEEPIDFEIGSNGQIFIIGNHRDTIDLDPGVGEFLVTTEGETDFYLIILNSDGGFSTAKTWGNTSDEGVLGISSLDNGNLIVTGYFKGTLDLDPGAGIELVNNEDDEYDSFVLTLSPEGDHENAFSLGGPNAIVAYDIIIDSSQDILLSGTFDNTVDFDPSNETFELTSIGDQNIFIAKYSSNYDLIWAKGFGNGEIHQRLRHFSIDNDNNILITGGFDGTMDADPGSGVFELSSNGGGDIFISKLQSDGDFLWAKGIGGSGFVDEGWSITATSDNEILVSGKFLETVDFDSGAGTFNLTSNGYKDIFLVHLDSNGDFRKAFSMGGPDLDVGVTVAVDSQDSVILGGTFRETADLHPGSIVYNVTSNGDADAFLLKLNSTILSGNSTILSSEIKAFPNPFQESLTIALPATYDEIKVEVYSALGQLVKKQSYFNVQQFDVSLEVSSGIYICNLLLGNDQIHPIRLIKQ